MAIRMIAADMDGTILKNDKTVSENTIKAVRAATQAGAYVTLCSGRMLESITPYSGILGVNAPVVCYNGALTYDEQKNRPTFEMTIDRDLAREICRFAEEENVYVQCFWEGNYYYERYTEKSLYYAKKCGVEGIKADGPLSRVVPCPAYKTLMILEPGQMDGMVKKVRERFGDRADFQPSSETFLECVAMGVSKAKALEKLCASLGIDKSEVMAFGDEQNDVSMLLYAGYGYAMANSTDAVKKLCGHMAKTNEDDGVARVIFEKLAAGEIGGKKLD